MASKPFVRSELIDQAVPPVASTGILGWLRANLFGSWMNSVLTVVSPGTDFPGPAGGGSLDGSLVLDGDIAQGMPRSH